jgi:hypothetical protein
MVIGSVPARKSNETADALKRLFCVRKRQKQMQHSGRIIVGALFVAGSVWANGPVLAANSHPSVIRPAASSTTRSSASRLSATANARAGNAAGNPYVNPNVAAGAQTPQANATANANAAEIRSAHQSVATP